MTDTSKTAIAGDLTQVMQTLKGLESDAAASCARQIQTSESINAVGAQVRGVEDRFDGMQKKIDELRCLVQSLMLRMDVLGTGAVVHAGGVTPGTRRAVKTTPNKKEIFKLMFIDDPEQFVTLWSDAHRAVLAKARSTYATPKQVAHNIYRELVIGHVAVQKLISDHRKKLSTDIAKSSEITTNTSNDNDNDTDTEVTDTEEETAAKPKVAAKAKVAAKPKAKVAVKAKAKVAAKPKIARRKPVAKRT